jgi:hypothetical protein
LRRREGGGRSKGRDDRLFKPWWSVVVFGGVAALFGLLR